MANTLAPYEVKIKHPEEDRPITVLRSAYDNGAYEGFEIVGVPDDADWPKETEAAKAAKADAAKATAAAKAATAKDPKPTGGTKPAEGKEG